MYATTFALLTTIGLALAVPGLMLFLAANVGPRRITEAKLATYESGIQHVVGSARERFSVKFYLIAILFILFDVEAVFLFPWAVNFQGLGHAGFVEMFVFIGVLLIGYVYILSRGALKWD
ncbi:MAG: NADH-quinone oxidoreductase subunit A [Candidatus Sericytochromatia bacterium]|uniref:NADH-quinone oxidoreductase subunit A n=1 Tax=Candidatus Tanganyikabacteria bacterium TaxID=2961651 RepID=A0A937X5Z8_9BACT|nr:NADH-quinone oxidoreductase subunit A [Candidatus Tanganyikabacteria bacterium]